MSPVCCWSLNLKTAKSEVHNPPIPLTLPEEPPETPKETVDVFRKVLDEWAARKRMP